MGTNNGPCGRQVIITPEVVWEMRPEEPEQEMQMQWLDEGAEIMDDEELAQYRLAQASRVQHVAYTEDDLRQLS